MLFHAILRDKPLIHLNKIGQADIVIGLPTYRTPPKLLLNTINTIFEGVKTYYPTYKVVIINADTGHNPRLQNVLNGIKPPANVHLVSGRYEGVRGQGASTCAILDGALHLNARAIIILEAHTKSIHPNWVPGLASPILCNQADLVKPRYTWPLPDGAMSDLLFYPFTRALWGLNLRHPAAGDFALSPELALRTLNEDVWYTEVNKSGIDIWLSTFAITEGLQVVQSALGEKIYPNKKPGKRATTIFMESIGTMLRQVDLRENKRPETTRITSIPTLTQYAPETQTEVVPQYDTSYFIEVLALGWMRYRKQWQRVMKPEHLTEIEWLASQPDHRFYFPSDLWAKIVYDFAVVYNKGDSDPDNVAASLYPLYLGRLASFWTEIAGLTVIGREGTVSAQAVEFEEQLSYLDHRWETYLPKT